MAAETEDAYDWLRSLPFPRPLVWRSYIYKRRLWYGFLCTVLLLSAVGIPLLFGLQQIQGQPSSDKLQPNQIAIYLGALVVVSYVMFVYTLFRQYDDVKWLGQRGEITEANILAVFRSQRKIFIGYRFWDKAGKEQEREAVIDIDSNYPLPELTSGMVVPLLYDPHKPEHRNYLWAEVSNYLVEKRRP